MLEIFQYSFMVRAFMAGVMIAIVAPLIGNFLVIRRYSLIADTLSHVALSGVAVGLLIGVQPLVFTVIFTIGVSLVIEHIRSNSNFSGDAILAMFLPAGLAFAIVLLSLTHNLGTNLFSYLFGSITTVSESELWLILGLSIVTVLVVACLHKRLLYSSFDEQSAQASGVNIKLVNSILLVLTATTVSLAMRIVGILLVGALMVIPVITAMQIARSFVQSLYISVIAALASVVIGLFLSYYFNLPAGGVIVLFSLILFGCVGAYGAKVR